MTLYNTNEAPTFKCIRLATSQIYRFSSKIAPKLASEGGVAMVILEEDCEGFGWMEA